MTSRRKKYKNTNIQKHKIKARKKVAPSNKLRQKTKKQNVQLASFVFPLHHLFRDQDETAQPSLDHFPRLSTNDNKTEKKKS